jgi:hypothetical protein
MDKETRNGEMDEQQGSSNHSRNKQYRDKKEMRKFNSGEVLTRSPLFMPRYIWVMCPHEQGYHPPPLGGESEWGRNSKRLHIYCLGFITLTYMLRSATSFTFGNLYHNSWCPPLSVCANM